MTTTKRLNKVDQSGQLHKFTAYKIGLHRPTGAPLSLHTGYLINQPASSGCPFASFFIPPCPPPPFVISICLCGQPTRSYAPITANHTHSQQVKSEFSQPAPIFQYLSPTSLPIEPRFHCNLNFGVEAVIPRIKLAQLISYSAILSPVF